MTDIPFSAWLSIHGPVDEEYSNANGPVALGYDSDASGRCTWVHPDDGEPYLVFSDTLRYRIDGEEHALDVVEVGGAA